VAGRYRIPGCAGTFGTRTRRSLMWRRINSVRPLEQSDWMGSKTVTRTSPAFFLFFILFYFCRNVCLLVGYESRVTLRKHGTTL
jgi:hypothetical protein